MLPRESQYIKNFTYEQAIEMAEGARGRDEDGYRIEFINMMKSFGLLTTR